MDRGKINKFLEYFSKQLSFEQVNYLNTVNNITQEKVGLFKDFSISLTLIIEDSYLGDDVIILQDVKM